MQFRNPANGHLETHSVPALWTVLFGGLYLIVCGLWAPAAIWLILSVVLVGWLGPQASVLIMLMSIVFAFMTPGMLRRNYLARGWQEEEDGTSVSSVRKCPACAEIVKAQAKLCRFCKTELPELEQVAPANPSDPNRAAYEALMCDKYGIGRIHGKYYRNGRTYECLEDAIGERASISMGAP